MNAEHAAAIVSQVLTTVLLVGACSPLLFLILWGIKALIKRENRRERRRVRQIIQQNGRIIM